MRLTLILGIAVLAFPLSSRGGFVDSLTVEQKREMGLESLTAEQRSALDAAIDRYRSTQEKAAAAAAVAEYKKKEEPVAVSRAVESYRKKEADRRVERIESRIKGKFRGWSGGTMFLLENGQVWSQVGSEVYDTRVVDSPEIEITKSPYGYYRLRLSDGAWVNVTRLK